MPPYENKRPPSQGDKGSLKTSILSPLSSSWRSRNESTEPSLLDKVVSPLLSPGRKHRSDMLASDTQPLLMPGGPEEPGKTSKHDYGTEGLGAATAMADGLSLGGQSTSQSAVVPGRPRPSRRMQNSRDVPLQLVFDDTSQKQQKPPSNNPDQPTPRGLSKETTAQGSRQDSDYQTSKMPLINKLLAEDLNCRQAPCPLPNHELSQELDAFLERHSHPDASSPFKVFSTGHSPALPDYYIPLWQEARTKYPTDFREIPQVYSGQAVWQLRLMRKVLHRRIAYAELEHFRPFHPRLVPEFAAPGVAPKFARFYDTHDHMSRILPDWRPPILPESLMPLAREIQRQYSDVFGQLPATDKWKFFLQLRYMVAVLIEALPKDLALALQRWQSNKECHRLW